MIVLGLDTATPSTAVALLHAAEPGAAVEARHAPAPGERPGHASRLLALAHELLAGAGLRFADVDRIAVGLGPGTFTGLRIGVATARALAQSTGAQLVGVDTLRALASVPDSPAVLAVVDARRGEAFVAGWRDGELRIAPAALGPAELAAVAPRGWRAVGDGAVRFRGELERAGCLVPPDSSPEHRVSAAAICRLSLEVGETAALDTVTPRYLRPPDAVIARHPTAP